MDMLTLSQVSKSFGSKTIVKDISFSVPEGSVFGFIGQNGAGKTTTMKMILGLLQMDGGEIIANENVYCIAIMTNCFCKIAIMTRHFIFANFSIWQTIFSISSFRSFNRNLKTMYVNMTLFIITSNFLGFTWVFINQFGLEI